MLDATLKREHNDMRMYCVYYYEYTKIRWRPAQCKAFSEIPYYPRRTAHLFHNAMPTYKEQLSNQYKGNENEIRKLVCWADVHMNLPVLERRLLWWEHLRFRPPHDDQGVARRHGLDLPINPARRCHG